MSMTVKRRNPECGKLRRPVKRHKIADGIYSSTLLYLKFLMIWSLVLMLDFILEFRFEYLWPFWLLVRSVYDSFKFQGLAFSVFFVCIAVTSDVICYLYIQNVQWLFFAASTYVWVQFVWQTDRGVCLPTLSLWLLFIYIEASVRLRELKTDPVPFNFNLARPFAAHCIGYPVVTLGFGFKSYVSYKIRLRKQREVRKGNEFFCQLLTEALPQKFQQVDKEKEKALPPPEETATSTADQTPPLPKKGISKCGATDSKVIDKHKSLDDFEYIEQVIPKQNNIYDYEGENEKGNDHTSTQKHSKVEKSESIIKESSKLNTQKETYKKNKNNLAKENTANNYVNNKEEVISRLEGELKRLKSDLSYSRSCEQELRSQINSLVVEDKSVRNELNQLRQDNESLQVRLHNLVTSRQQDKQNVSALEKKLAEEKKSRSQAEQKLAVEQKAKKAEEAVAARAVALVSRGECTDACKNRFREMENEMGQLRRELSMRDEQLRQLELETQMLRQNKDAQNETEVLMSALAAMQDKTTHLEKSLSAETRVKLDLFSALGDAKRQIEIQQGMLVQREKEITELKLRVGEVLALVPSNHVSSPLPINGEAAPGAPYLSMPESEDPDVLVKSKLNPNASDYTPKINN